MLDELQKNLLEIGIPSASADHRIAQMQSSFPDPEVRGYEPLVPMMTCDAKDRHVLAAAVRANAEVLVTFNVKDFPVASTRPYDISVLHTDDFLLDQLDLHQGLTVAAVAQASSGLAEPADDRRRTAGAPRSRRGAAVRRGPSSL